MRLALHKLTLQLDSDDPRIQAGWETIFAGWPTTTAVPDLILQLSTATILPLPSQMPIFTDDQTGLSGGRILSVYQHRADQVGLHFIDSAFLTVPLTSDAPTVINGVITAYGLDNGRLEDVTFTSIAPFLRRQGYFLLHAFAASHDGQAILIVGASGSGKTTTGLNLLLNGWGLLANDVALLEQRDDGIYALPLPGIVSIRQPSFALLPGLHQLIGDQQPDSGVYQVTSERVGNGRYALPAPISAIYFPHIAHQPHTTRQPLAPAISLAQMMAESVDQWDGDLLIPHMSFLQTLSQQAAAYTLQLGRDLDQIHPLLTAT